MCGISGLVYFNDIKATRKIVSDFNNQLAHRGPDGHNIWIDDKLNLGLGHRRLSILDLSDQGSQPMSLANDRFTMVYNGEVYNFIELRNELIQLGHSFRSDSDSEVVLAAYAEWGSKCVNKFNGMWAIAIVDQLKKELFLSRDRFGIKPLHYTNHKGIFAFASESIAFNKLYGFQKRMNSNNTLNNIRDVHGLESTGETIYENIFQLRAGHNAKLNLETRNFRVYKWWSTIENKVEVPENYEDQVAGFRELFEDSTRLRMRSDVSLASALSGGVDSSAVYCMINHLMKKSNVNRAPKNWQRAYNIGYPNSIFDESHFAKQVIEYTGGEGRFLQPNYNSLSDDIISTTLLFDSIYNMPIYPLTIVYGNMHMDDYKISMDGHGVDEMMYGYRFSVKNLYMNAIRTGNKEQEISILNTYLGLFPEKDKYNEKEYLKSLVNSLNVRKKNILEKGIRKLCRMFSSQNSNSTLWSFLEKGEPIKNPLLEGESELNKGNWHLYQIFHKSILPSILRNFDRGAMQKSIEIRMPFMDWRLISYIFSLPLESKIGGGYTKRILRDSMKGIMPENIRTRKLKVGMSSPMPKWFGDELKPLILDELNSISFQNSDLWQAKRVLSFVENKMYNNSWTYEECKQFWPIFNAHILTKNLNG